MPSTTPNSAAGGAIPSEGEIILDDSEYLVEVNVNCRQHAAPGFLLRRCAHSLHTPGGWECVGSFQLRPDQCWSAEVTTLPVDDDINCTELGRFDAILALWHFGTLALWHFGSVAARPTAATRDRPSASNLSGA